MSLASFTIPNLLLFLTLAALALAALIYGRARRRRILASLVAPPLAGTLVSSLHPGLRVLRHGLFFAGVFLVMLALCRPQWGSRLVPAPARSRDILFVVDTSRSMLAKDLPPSRLEHAKWCIRQLAEKCTGDRFGLIAFAGDAFPECPLTQDLSTFLQLLQDVNSGTIPAGGTNIAQALKTARKALGAAQGGHQAVVLLSDGEEQQGTAVAETTWFRDSGIPLCTVGLGDSETGAILQLEDNSLVRDKNGEPVRSRMNAAALQDLAVRTGGVFVHSTALDPNIAPVLRCLQNLVPEENKGGVQKRPIERYQIPLFLGILCLLARLALGERRRGGGTPRRPTATAVLLAALLLPGLRIQAAAAPAAPAGPVPAIGDALRVPTPSPDELRKRIGGAEKELAGAKRGGDRARLNFNLGVYHQLLGEAAAARKNYESVLGMGAAAVPPELRALACQNLGVLEHVAARETVQKDPDAAITSMKSAQSLYREGLRLFPANRSLPSDLELAERDLKQAEEQKKEIEKQKQQSEQKQKEQQKQAEQAKKDTQEALQKQQQANKEQEQPKREERQQAADQAAQKAKESVDKAAGKKAQPQPGQKPEERSKTEQASDEIAKAQEAQKQASPHSCAPEDKQKAAGGEAEQHLKAALDKLAEAQKEQKQQDGQQKQDGSGQEQKQDQPKPENQKIGDPPPGEEKSGKQEAQPLEKQQAAAILRQMQEEEKDYRDYIKEQQRKNSRIAEPEKNW